MVDRDYKMFQPNSVEFTSDQRKDCVVLARHICKRFGNEPPVLNKLNMTIRKGTTYGLLGSSGCGKTTLLTCMVGLREWDSGELLVLGLQPGATNNGNLRKRLGYMPQDLSLYAQLSIEETFRFYGRLYNLSEEQVTERWIFLKSLLEFSDNLGLICDISGGERRRASLALALIHKPEFLLLDEPTVGLDPLLRHKVWSYLHKIVEIQNTTILITTHYIEEARFLNTIGVMRNGRLIAEDSPANLLQKFNCQLLEQCVTSLCHEDETKILNCLNNPEPLSLTSVSTKNSKNARKFFNSAESRGSNTINEFDLNVSQNYDLSKVSLAKKNIDSNENNAFGVVQKFQKVLGFTIVLMLTFIRHPVFLGMLLIMPTIQCCLIVVAVGSRFRYMNFGIVNNDLTNWTAECQLLQNNESSCDIRTLNCKFLNKLKDDNVLYLQTYNSEAVALEQAQKGNVKGYLVIPSNYSEHITEFALESRFSANETLEGSKIHARIDHSEYLIAYYLIKHLYNSYFDYTQEVQSLCGLSSQISQLIEFRKPVYGDFKVCPTS